MRAGRFGVGVFAAFLLGPQIAVVTRHVTAAEDQGLEFVASLEDEHIQLRRCSAKSRNACRRSAQRAGVSTTRSTVVCTLGSRRNPMELVPLRLAATDCSDWCGHPGDALAGGTRVPADVALRKRTVSQVGSKAISVHLFGALNACRRLPLTES